MDILPLFPLKLVLLPYEILPLHIFEPRYKKMVKNAIEDKQPFGIVLKEEGYIDNVVFVNKEDSKEDIRIFLRYHNESPAITTIEKISKPGKRVYVASDDIPRVLNGLGISVISSSKGVISNKVARELKVGGELLCNVW